MDLSKLSDDDLLALKSGDLTKVSDDGLMHLKGEPPTFAGQFKKELLGSVPGGLLRGVKDVIDTGAQLAASGYDKLTGSNEGARVQEMNRAGKAEFDAAAGIPAKIARVGGNLLGTAPLTAGVGAGLGAAGLTRLGQAVTTGGFSTGSGLADLGIRSAGGAIAGGLTAGAVNPEDAATGAVIGAALPPALKVAGEAGKAIGRVIRGPEVPEARRVAVQAANDLGLVIPPSQAKPTLTNRALEGFSGKITTAQNASAKNQPVFNALAKAEIGAQDLTPEGISAVRKTANSAYDQLAQVGAFQSDEAFRTGVRKTAAMTDALKRDFPELVNADVEKLVEGITARESFNAQGTIEAIKRLRFDGSANRIAQDPGKKALGKAQMSIANELENLVDRNLEKIGQPELLTAYREARTTLAKTYDLEKAINPATFNVDANKLAQINKRGRLTGGLKDIADFAGTFPKAAQAVEKMGSLPQVSPLDFGAMGVISGATANPLFMAGVVARPAARAAVLSPMIQNRLALQSGELSINPLLSESLYRSAPLIATQR